MPEWFDLDSERSDSTEVPEARLLVKPSNTSFKVKKGPLRQTFLPFSLSSNFLLALEQILTITNK